MDLIFILLLVLLVFGGGFGYYGYRRGAYPVGGFGGILGICVLLLVLYFLFGHGRL